MGLSKGIKSQENDVFSKVNTNSSDHVLLSHRFLIFHIQYSFSKYLRFFYMKDKVTILVGFVILLKPNS